jgi:hypothetical protein
MKEECGIEEWRWGVQSTAKNSREKAKQGATPKAFAAVLVLQYIRIMHFREDCQRNDCQRNGKKNLKIIPLTNIPLTIPAFPPPQHSSALVVAGCALPLALFRGHSFIVNPPGHLISAQPAHHNRVVLRLVLRSFSEGGSRPGEGGSGDSRSNPVKVNQTSSGTTESHFAGANCMQILYHECLTALTKFHPVKVSQTGPARRSRRGEGGSNPIKVNQTSSGTTESHSATSNCVQILYHEWLTALTKFHPVKVSQSGPARRSRRGEGGSNRFSLQSNSSKSSMSQFSLLTQIQKKKY